VQVGRMILAVVISGAGCAALALPASAASPLDGALHELRDLGAPVPPSTGDLPSPPPGLLPADPASGLPEPVGGELKGLAGPLAPPSKPEPAPRPRRVSPEDCVADGGNVERTRPDQELGTTYYCNGGTHDGRGVSQ